MLVVFVLFLVATALIYRASRFDPVNASNVNSGANATVVVDVHVDGDDGTAPETRYANV